MGRRKRKMSRPSKQTTEASERVSSDLFEQYRESIFSEIKKYSEHEEFRKRVQDIVDDCTKHIDFVDRVKSYAGRELDERIFKNGMLVLFWFISIIVSAAIGAFFSKLIK